MVTGSIEVSDDSQLNPFSPGINDQISISICLNKMSQEYKRNVNNESCSLQTMEPNSKMVKHDQLVQRKSKKF